MWETGPPSGSRRGPTGPRAHSWGGGPGWGEPSPTHPLGVALSFGSCVCTVCASVVSDGVSVSVNRSVCARARPGAGGAGGPAGRGALLVKLAGAELPVAWLLTSLRRFWVLFLLWRKILGRGRKKGN